MLWHGDCRSAQSLFDDRAVCPAQNFRGQARRSAPPRGI